MLLYLKIEADRAGIVIISLRVKRHRLWRHGLMVRTRAFEACNSGSNPDDALGKNDGIPI